MGHLENWVEDSARQRLVRSIDPIQSEWPAHTSATVAAAANTSGYATPNSGSASLILAIPSSKWFKWRTLIVDNETGVTNTLAFYAGGSAAAATQSIFQMHLNGNETQFIALDCITVGRDIWANAAVGNAHIRVGGLLVQSGPEN
jgi:hypothetical protein